MAPGFSQKDTVLQVSGSNTTATTTTTTATTAACPPKSPSYSFWTVLIGLGATLVFAIVVIFSTFQLMGLARTAIQQHSRHHRQGKQQQAGRWEILHDSEGYGSLTNFQFFLWTAVFLFSIVWVYAVRIQGGVLTPTVGWPSNALALMGVNTVSAVMSKAIDTNKQSKSKAIPKYKERSLWTMFNEDDGRPTLARVQMFIWTWVSVTIYIYILFTMFFGPFLNSNVFVATPLCALTIPDVDPTLVTLMGLSHAAYLGKKYYTTPSP